MGNCHSETQDQIKERAYRIISVDELRNQIATVGNVRTYNIVRNFMYQIPICTNISFRGYGLWEAFNDYYLIQTPLVASSLILTFDMIVQITIHKRDKARIGLSQEQYEFLFRK